MPKICPAVGESTVAVGCPRFTWLNVLNDSARNCALILSVNRKVLLNDMSALKSFGPKNESRATLPKVPGCGRLQGPRVQPFAFNSAVAAVVARHPFPLVPGVATANHPDGPGFGTLAMPTRLGRHGPVSRPSRNPDRKA